MPVQKVCKEDVLRHAFRLFKLQGYHRTTLQDVANACGLLKGSIYHYFDSKESLMKEVLLSGHYQVKTQVLSMAYDVQLSVRQRMIRVFERLQNTYLQDEGGCIMGNIGLETSDTLPEFRHIILSFFQDWIAAFAFMYAEKMPAEKAREKAERNVMTLEGAIMLCRVFQDNRYIKNTLQQLLEEV